MGYTGGGRTSILRSAARRNASVPDEVRSTSPDIEPIRAFAEECPAAVVVLAGPAHRILYANPALCIAAGRSPDALHGLPAAEAFPRVLAAGHLETLDRVSAAGLPWTCRAQPLRLPLDEGEPRVWDIEATPLRSAGVVAGLLLQLRDVSAQCRAEAALHEALASHQALAREAEHRIKNSLQLVASLLRLQSSHMAEPAGRAAVEAATARVLAVAEAHRALQRSPDLRSVRLSDLLDELAAGTAVQHPGTDLRTEADESLTLDAERAIPLALVLAELVEDAVRRAPRPGPAPASVRLSAHRDGDAMRLELTDGGAPADEEEEAPGLGDKVVRALTRQIGAVLATERLPCGLLRTALRLPSEPARPSEC
jgi:two-component sensor histidine kinase